MNRCVFPYGIEFQEDGRLNLFPAVDAILFGQKGRGLKVRLLLDSGAAVTTLPVTDANRLGVTLERGNKIVLQGITGEGVLGYRHLAFVQICNTKIEIPVVFVDDKSTPRLLGRDGIFTHFTIIFDEAKHRIVFLPQNEERKLIDSLF